MRALQQLQLQRLLQFNFATDNDGFQNFCRSPYPNTDSVIKIPSESLTIRAYIDSEGDS
jgi:hypothetical protein